MIPLSLEELQLNLRIKVIKDFCEPVLKNVFNSVAEDRFSVPIFFELPTYRMIVGPRGPDYRKPFTLDNYAKLPSIENLSDPGYCNFSENMEVLGFMKPYKVYIANLLRLAPIGRPAVIEHYEAINGCSYDKEWHEFKKTDATKSAMTLTRKLFSALNRKCVVIRFDIVLKYSVAMYKNLKHSPGLPFCTDSSMQTKADCLDRAFELAKEINASAIEKKPSKVQAPPCMIAASYDPSLNLLQSDFSYPLAVEIVEQRFVEVIRRILCKSDNMGEMPINVGIVPILFEHCTISKLIRGSNRSCTIGFDNISCSVHPSLIDFAFSVIQNWFAEENSKKKAKENRKVFEFLKYYFTHTPIVFPSGQVFRKHGGAMSGSLFKPLVCSIVVTFVTVYCMQKQGIGADRIRGHVFVWGDAVTFVVPGNFSTAKFVKDAESLGFPVDKESIVFSKNIDLSHSISMAKFLDTYTWLTCR